MDGNSDGEATEPRPAVEPPTPDPTAAERKAARRDAKRRALNPDDPDPAWLSRGSGRRSIVGICLVIVVVVGVAALGWVWFEPAGAVATHEEEPSKQTCRITQHKDERSDVPAPKELGSTAPRATATVTTNVGKVTVLLFGDVAPCSVSNFEYLTQHDFYKNNDCHRLTTQQTDPTMTLRCGDPEGTGKGGPGYRFNGEDAFTNEVGRDYVALVNDSKGMAGSSFAFIRGQSKPTSSLSVIGRVIAGNDVLDQIGAAAGIEAYDDKPPQPVLIEQISIEKGTVTIPPTDGSPSGGSPTGTQDEPSSSGESSPGEETSSDDGGIDLPN